VRIPVSDTPVDKTDLVNYELQLLKDLDNSVVVTKELEGDGYWKRNVCLKVIIYRGGLFKGIANTSRWSASLASVMPHHSCKESRGTLPTTLDSTCETGRSI